MATGSGEERSGESEDVEVAGAERASLYRGEVSIGGRRYDNFDLAILADDGAASRLPRAIAARLGRLGVLPTTARTARPPVPPARPGTAFNALDDLGRPTGAAATITRDMLGTGTRAAQRIRPPDTAPKRVMRAGT